MEYGKITNWTIYRWKESFLQKYTRPTEILTANIDASKTRIMQ